ncbi:hypothetical protein N7495_007366 [Penicillium taxi]|uniref:uncharacterized protein n=1 Tax=Penicillium taxi TaxID=168475 RepID=UPI0025454DEB|nr:uncharacterized protein N7495_007366 [Penicillium taxi]KAJ5895675.1 hypothetical protein N7495_007366 [Penicillium taxi]
MLLLCVGFLAILYVFYTIIFRLLFHPLAKYPGPWQAAITDWYAAFYVWRGNSHVMLLETHQKYGDIVRFGPNSLSLNSHTGLAAIYSRTANVRKDDAYVVMSASLHAPNTISCIDKQAHAFKKRILTQVFTHAALKGVEDRILFHVRRFCDKIAPDDKSNETKKNWGHIKDMAALSDYVAFDIISDLCYGKSFDMLRSKKFRSFTKITTTLSRRNAVCFVQSKLWRFKLDRIFFANLLSHIKEFGAWIRQQAKARTELGNNVSQKDCFHYMLNARDPNTGEPFTERELWTESLQLIVAGSDTIAVALSATLFHLAHNHEALNKLTREIRSSFNSVEDILMGNRLNSCKFLRASITESLRMSPPFAGIPTRRVLAGGIDVDGHHLPEGIIVGTPIYTIHHEERYYPRPFKFDPERWLELEDGNEESVRNQANNIKLATTAFCPFSIGPRTCVAKNMAWVELSLIIARLVFQYDMRLPPEHFVKKPQCCGSVNNGFERSPEYKLKAWIASGREGPSIQFRRSDLS